MTHDASSSPADSDPCRCGRMTLVTLVSRICMKATTMTVKVMAHFRVGEIGTVSGAGGVTALLGIRLDVGEPLGLGHRESVIPRLAVGRELVMVEAYDRHAVALERAAAHIVTRDVDKASAPAQALFDPLASPGVRGPDHGGQGRREVSGNIAARHRGERVEIAPGPFRCGVRLGAGGAGRGS